jgi:hypothetical protein
MIKHPFTVREAMNTHLMDFVRKTAEAFRMNGNEGLYAGFQPVILEDAGTFTIQRDWTDETGYYVTFRLAPLDSGKPVVQEHAAASEARWNAMFPGAKKRWREVVDHLDLNTRVTLFVSTGLYSIGD